MTMRMPYIPGGAEARGAVFSSCGDYRYALWRLWGVGRPLVIIGLNPSTADANADDPTIRRCIAFAKRDSYAGILMLNLFALRSTEPDALLTHPAPSGPGNDAALGHLVHGCDKLAAWGAHKAVEGRAHRVIDLVGRHDLYCLGRTKDGHPRHPLYMPADAPMIPYGREGTG